MVAYDTVYLCGTKALVCAFFFVKRDNVTSSISKVIMVNDSCISFLHPVVTSRSVARCHFTYRDNDFSIRMVFLLRKKIFIKQISFTTHHCQPQNNIILRIMGFSLFCHLECITPLLPTFSLGVWDFRVMQHLKLVICLVWRTFQREK